MTHNTLQNYYKVNFALAQHHKWDIASIENLYPYERDIYVEMLQELLQGENAHAVKPDIDMLQEILKKKADKK